MSDIFMMGTIIVAVLNATLATALLGVYGLVYRGTRSAFSLALLMVAAAFLAQNLLVLYASVSMMPMILPPLHPYVFAIGLLEVGGLGALVYTATR